MMLLLQNILIHQKHYTSLESITNPKPMRYGENPHQSGVFYGDLNKLFDQLNGKELSYNNLVDVDAAIQLISEVPLNPPRGGTSDSYSSDILTQALLWQAVWGGRICNHQTHQCMWHCFQTNHCKESWDACTGR